MRTKYLTSGAESTRPTNWCRYYRIWNWGQKTTCNKDLREAMDDIRGLKTEDTHDKKKWRNVHKGCVNKTAPLEIYVCSGSFWARPVLENQMYLFYCGTSPETAFSNWYTCANVNARKKTAIDNASRRFSSSNSRPT